MAPAKWAWEYSERRIGRGRRCQTISPTDRRRRRHPWPRRRRRCLPCPPLPLRSTALTLWVATSVLAAQLPCRVDRVPRAAHVPSRCPLVETGALQIPEFSRCPWQQQKSCWTTLRSLPSSSRPTRPPRLFYLPVPRVRPYVPRHCRKTTSHTQILYLVWAGKRWMTWKARGDPEP